MAYRTQRHDDWRGKDGTAFSIRTMGGDSQYIFAGSDHGACHYESLTCTPGYSISRSNAADTIRQAREAGHSVVAIRYVVQG